MAFLLCLADKRDVRAGNINRERELQNLVGHLCESQNLVDIFGNATVEEVKGKLLSALRNNL